jgi:GTP cyclohydrolase I
MPPLKEKPTMANRETRSKKVFKRKEFLEWLGKNQNDKSLDNSNIRLCQEYPFETMSKTVNVDTGKQQLTKARENTKSMFICPSQI